jgi:hypothetical protein
MSEDARAENVETVRERLATVLSGFTNISRENGPYGSSMTRILLTPGQAAALADRLDHAKAERKAGAVDALREAAEDIYDEWATDDDPAAEGLRIAERVVREYIARMEAS